jgi:hypothetical protein
MKYGQFHIILRINSTEFLIYLCKQYQVFTVYRYWYKKEHILNS